MPTSSPSIATFFHPELGTLTIENGLDTCAWAYGLNTAVFPTYGGEVIQILSIYVDDLTVGGTCATYDQITAIYKFFGTYMQIATQGKDAAAQQKNNGTGSSYNIRPVIFTYTARDWRFLIYPQAVPQFRFAREVVAPTWQMQAFVIDDSPDLGLIKDGITSQTVTNAQGPLSTTPTQGVFTLQGEISPKQGNPDTDPFQTYTKGLADAQNQIGQYADYYNNLIPAYANGDFSAITGAIGSRPTLGTTPATYNGQSTVTVPGKPTNGTGGGVSHIENGHVHGGV